MKLLRPSGKSIRIVDMDREEHFSVSNTTNLHLEKKKATDLDFLGTKCHICTGLSKKMDGI